MASYLINALAQVTTALRPAHPVSPYYLVLGNEPLAHGLWPPFRAADLRGRAAGEVGPRGGGQPELHDGADDNRADSPISSVAACSSRPSAGTISPASIATMSPGTSCAAGISASWPSCLTLAVMITIFCRAATACRMCLGSGAQMARVAGWRTRPA